MRPENKWFAGFVALLLGITAIFVLFGEPQKNLDQVSEAILPKPEEVSRSKPVEGPVREFLNFDSKVAYMGDENCATCHLEETDSFRAHPMGRSMAKITDFAAKPTSSPYTVGNYRFSVEKRGSQIIHIEEELGNGGQVLKKVEEPISWVVGSGQRGHAFLVEKSGKFFQSPISWYSSLEKYNLSPGYELGNMHFDRPILQACLNCHSNRVESTTGDALKLHGTAIGCERCHGPGELHAKEQKIKDGYDQTIVNPAKLSSTRRDHICYQCHMQLEARQDLPDKSIYDFKPGQDLMTFIKRNSNMISDPVARLKAVGHVQQMEESRCFKADSSKFGCTTCHNPHDFKNPKERQTDYLKKCLSCHTDQNDCSLPMPTRTALSPADDCIACHMPSRKTADIGHTALTDHSIKRHTPAYEAMKRAKTP